MTSARSASSSAPSASTCSGVRWASVLGAVAGTNVRIAMGLLSELDLDVARGTGDAGADGFAGGVVQVAAVQVPDGTGAELAHAGVADAHPAAVGQQGAGGL